MTLFREGPEKKIKIIWLVVLYHMKGWSVKMSDIKYTPENLIGKTIKTIEKLKAEFGRTYDHYLCITCEDGTRVMIHGGEVHLVNPTSENMQKITFFTPEEIAEKASKEYRKKLNNIRDSEEREKREFERLKKKYSQGE